MKQFPSFRSKVRWFQPLIASNLCPAVCIPFCIDAKPSAGPDLPVTSTACLLPVVHSSSSHMHLIKYLMHEIGTKENVRLCMKQKWKCRVTHSSQSISNNNRVRKCPHNVHLKRRVRHVCSGLQVFMNISGGRGAAKCCYLCFRHTGKHNK